MLLDGLHVPLTVPFYRGGALYYRKLEHNVSRLSQTPASALIAFGFGSEAQALSDAETAESLRTIASVAAKEKVLIARIERSSVTTAVAMAEQAAAADFDAVLLAAPARWARGSDTAQSAGSTASVYFRTVADRSPLPVILWSGEGSVHAPISEREIAELAMHPQVLGLYDIALDAARLRKLQAATAAVKREVVVTPVFAAATNRMLNSVESEGKADFVPAATLGGGVALASAPPRPALKTRTRTVGFQMLGAGSTRNMCDLLEAGSPGVSPLLAAAAPQACYEVLAAWKDGNPQLAREKQERLALPDDVSARLGLGAVKYACDLNGYYGGAPRLPYLTPTAEERAEIEAAFRYVRN